MFAGTGESVSHHKHRLAGNHGDSLDVSLENETGVTPMGTYRQPELSNDSQKQGMDTIWIMLTIIILVCVLI